jgi:hypothetical protein|tara:strand:- start:8708 stop:9034 length:327 start_codon:yes stop_codon:yes gene_type:complete
VEQYTDVDEIQQHGLSHERNHRAGGCFAYLGIQEPLRGLCYCVSGTGRVTDHANGSVHEIMAGVLYALDQHDNHTLTVDDGMDMFLISVCNSALQGDEVHGEDGSYSA